MERARVIQEQLTTLFAITRQGRNAQSYSAAALSGFKTGLKLLGVITSNRMHEPMQGLTAEDEERVKAVMQRTGLL